ncbi:MULTISPECIES: arylamine N-acetyltransferase [Bacillus]|uniref:Arylamine N-acetyltransferase n=1 Tax=Bacillus glycinifermentans TaxID=1664069 RepID=A0AAJ3Z399_9BACI|nr:MULTISPECIES: arylamine N-acetyltransferase [Bacillus]KKB72735.1 acetyltransferase [Bacillus sp. TH008]MDU0073417.1 arylamine N-acetyltransferase [Bacillus sp. IG6]MED8021271.1 arylamine N-acetyltransferase [Bacillus glycinifermentans]QAT67175.1 arylamine N-acetyltransferase [Bacillus glycinifermentans]WKB76813.1 arylamine N-acetyltransferase [Bacillus glycinifermentans]
MTAMLDALYKRIGYPPGQGVSFADLPEFLSLIALQFPFENGAVLNKERIPMTKEGLTDALLNNKRGGLCYDLNAFLYYVLKEIGFSVQLVQGTVFHPQEGKWALTGTHVAVILQEGNETYLLDTGFGANLPLKPVPFTGESVSSKTGVYRIRKAKTEKGDYLLEMDKGKGWQTGYAFTLEPIDEAVLADVRDAIFDHEDSPFNKNPLASKLTKDGKLILSKDHFTKHSDGGISKEAIQQEEFRKIFEDAFFD